MILSVGPPLSDEQDFEEPCAARFDVQDALRLWKRSALKWDYLHVGRVPLEVGGLVYLPRFSDRVRKEEGKPLAGGGPSRPPAKHSSNAATCAFYPAGKRGGQ
jgi:hypothetical protein